MSEPPGFFDPKGAMDAWMMVNGPYIGGGCITLFGGGLFLGGYFSMVDVFRGRRVARDMAKYDYVWGKVRSSEVLFTTTKYGGKLWYPSIEYEYEVRGRTYRSTHFLPDSFKPAHGEEWANGWARKYPAGTTLAVFHDPRQPQYCVVERNAESVRRYGIMDFMLGLFLFAVGGICLWMAFFKIFPEGGKPLPTDWYDGIPAEAPAEPPT